MLAQSLTIDTNSPVARAESNDELQYCVFKDAIDFIWFENNLISS